MCHQQECRGKSTIKVVCVLYVGPWYKDCMCFLVCLHIHMVSTVALSICMSVIVSCLVPKVACTWDIAFHFHFYMYWLKCRVVVVPAWIGVTCCWAVVTIVDCISALNPTHVKSVWHATMRCLMMVCMCLVQGHSKPVTAPPTPVTTLHLQGEHCMFGLPHSSEHVMCVPWAVVVLVHTGLLYRYFIQIYTLHTLVVWMYVQ